MAMTSGADRRRAEVRGLGLLAVVLAISSLPVVIASIAGLSEWSSPFLYASMATAMGASLHLRFGLALGLGSGVLSMVAVLLNPYPVAGAVFIALICLGVGLASRAGAHRIVALVPIVVLFALAQPASINAASTVGNALATGSIMFAGTLWTALLWWLLLEGRIPKARLERSDDDHTYAYAILLTVTAGISTWWVMAHERSHAGAWLVMTIILILQPSAGETIRKSAGRTAGTIGGVVVAGVIAALVSNPTVTILLSITLVFLAIAVSVLKRPYWQFVTLLTPAVVLMDSAGGDVGATIGERLGFTLAGVVITLVVVLAAKGLVDLWLRAHPSPRASTAPKPIAVAFHVSHSAMPAGLPEAYPRSAET